LERSQVNLVFQHTASAHRDLPAAGSRAARCAVSARRTVRPSALLGDHVRRSARRPAVTAVNYERLAAHSSAFAKRSVAFATILSASSSCA
jgi:hypothetical protein